MTSLRQRMIEDMRVRNLAVGTQAIYLRHVSQFARHFGKSPAALGREQIRSFQVYLIQEKKLDPSTITVAVSAIRFLYKVTLRRQWNFDEIIPAPKRPRRLPVILSPEEILQFLDRVPAVKHRTILTTCYAAGLRVSEVVRLLISDIDSQRMVIRIEQSKGQKDRYVMLSPRLLGILRDWWRTEKPQHWLFPGSGVDRHVTTGAVEQACQRAHRLGHISKPITPHSLRHAFAAMQRYFAVVARLRCPRSSLNGANVSARLQQMNRRENWPARTCFSQARTRTKNRASSKKPRLIRPSCSVNV